MHLIIWTTLVQYSLAYKKPLYKKLRHSIFEKMIDKTIDYRSVYDVVIRSNKMTGP